VAELGAREGKGTLYRLYNQDTGYVDADGITFHDLVEQLLTMEREDGVPPDVTHEGEMAADASDWLNLYRKGEI
jgi:hypothetical protein